MEYKGFKYERTKSGDWKITSPDGLKIFPPGLATEADARAWIDGIAEEP